MPEITDKLWTQNVDVLYQKNRINELYPTNDMTLLEKLNSLMRISVLIGITLTILIGNYMYLYVPLVMAFLQIGAVHMEPKILNSNNDPLDNQNDNQNDINDIVNDNNNNKNNKNKNIKEKFQNSDERSNIIGSPSTCIKPTLENPFMNAMNYDSRYRQPACTSYDNKEVQDNIDNFFDDNLFKDVSDIYNKRHSQRQFYTMPYTTYPNDNTKFAKWLYGEPPTCKEGNGAQCVANNYERLQGTTYKLV